MDNSRHYQRLKAFVTRTMRQGERDEVTWNLLLSTLFASRRSFGEDDGLAQEVEWLLEAKHADGFQRSDRSAFALLVTGLEDLGAESLARHYFQQLDECTEGDVTGWLDGWHAHLSHRSVPGQLNTSFEVLDELLEKETVLGQGRRPTTETLDTIFRTQTAHCSSPQHPRNVGQSFNAKRAKEVLSQLEQKLGVLPSHKTYELAMQRCSPTFADCVSIYQDARRDSVPTSAGMVKAAVRQMATPTRPEELKFVQSVYTDLMTSPLSDNRSKDGMFNVGMYVELLRVCARPESPNFTWAIQLLEDMRHNGLSYLNSSHTDSSMDCAEMSTSGANIVTSLMRTAATNHSQAFKIYAWTWPMDQDNIFTYRDWYQVIRTFADLDFPAGSDGKRSYVPPSVFFAFFEDMRKSGTAPGSEIFQAVLHYYAREGHRPSASVNQEAVRQIHDLIKMDQFSGTPDIGLMNRLMYAYSKTGNLDGAFNVWRSVLVNKIPYNNVSISIILDAYGFAGRHTYSQLTGLWFRLLQREDFSVNKKNLESYVEALGRIGYRREAVDEVFRHLQAPAAGGRELRPDERTFEVLLKAIRQDSGLYSEVLDKVQGEHPDLWRAVSSVAGSGSRADREAKVLLSS